MLSGKKQFKKSLPAAADPIVVVDDLAIVADAPNVDADNLEGVPAKHPLPLGPNDNILERLPRDILGMVFGYAKSYSTLFNVSQNMREKVWKRIGNDPVFVTFAQGEACFTVHGWIALNDDNFQPRTLTQDDMNGSRASVTRGTSYKLQAMVAAKDMKQQVLYIQKTANGIQYSLLCPEEEMVDLGHGSTTSKTVYKPQSGEITAASLPLLDMAARANQPFDIKKYHPLLERMVTILSKRGVLHEKLTLPVFKNREDAEAYAATRYNPRYKTGATMGIVHECTMAQTVRVLCHKTRAEQEFTDEAANQSMPVLKELPMAYMLKSNLLLSDNSYPCDAAGKAVALADAPDRKCIVM